MLSPEVGKALLRWIAFIVIVAGVGVLAAPRHSGAFVLSVLMLCVGLLSGGLLYLVLRGSRRS
ncbi:hypothetical protein [Phytohabitans rumicis]|uniref:Uncharacterized protein n=1 Tax=Phytohabitans rumicis TaxID=1076125 RepID=A0A6V8LC69_9ACTN|nr:hypothetical protein [Phytohabitans rumicis]GFJ91647.1 hypothetical protein Prum_052890 [Phytohabitans rumicis]